AAQTEMAAADRDCARGDEDHLLLAAAAARDVVRQRVEPVAPDLAVVIHQQSRADLDDKPPCPGQRGSGGGCLDNSLSAPGGGEGPGEVGDSRAVADVHLTLPT